MRLATVAGRVLTAAACLAVIGLAAGTAEAAPPKYDYFVVGDPADAVATPTGGLALMGGGTDQDAAFQWMNGRSGGGDFLVIRTTGTDAYNQWIYDFGGVNSAATLVIKNAAATTDPFVINTIKGAEALFIAGGDQSTYTGMWKGTPVEDAIQFVIDKGGVIGGTSAGLMVLSEFIYTGELGAIVSSQALANPFHRYVTLTRDFLTVPMMAGKLTEAHLIERDRMGRHLTFLARLINDGWASDVKGIALERESAFLVLPNGSGSLVGPAGTAAAYFTRTAGQPQVCQNRTPLTYLNIPVYKVTGSATFNINTWTGSGGVAYTLSVNNGVLTSTQPGGNIY
jgi:cyanophycinase-like exopeptidase